MDQVTLYQLALCLTIIWMMIQIGLSIEKIIKKMNGSCTKCLN